MTIETAERTGVGLGRGGCMSRKRKRDAVLRMLRGEDLDPDFPVRPDGAVYQWRKVPPSELSVELVADERLGWATDRAEAS